MTDHAEPVPERGREHSRPGRRADQCKVRQVKTDRPRSSSLSDHDIDRVVFHRRVQDLLHLSVQPMDLIHEQDIPRLQIIENCGHLPRLFNGRAARHFHMRSHLIGNDSCQRRLSQSRRAVKKNMVERISSLFCRLDVDLQICLGLLLTDIIRKHLRSQALLNFFVLDGRFRRDFSPHRHFNVSCFSDHCTVFILYAQTAPCFLMILNHYIE